jgi:hypothetical protein
MTVLVAESAYRSIRNYNLANTVRVVLAHASLKAGIYDSIK